MAEMTWRQAIEQVLKQSPEPLHYKAVSERIGELKLKVTLGATPAATVAAQLYGLAKDAETGIEQVGKGVFRLKGNAVSSEAAQTSSPLEIATETGAIRAFGMFWLRNRVIWSGKAKLLGKQQAGADAVDFSDQIGVYLLHDRERVVYVGRAADSIYKRLKDHNSDRLSGRWDRFSWFGLKGVLEDGSGLTAAAVTWNHEVVINTLEAILIESLEPPLNRRQGDGFAATEYLQAEDPTIQLKKNKEIVEEIAKKMGVA